MTKLKIGKISIKNKGILAPMLEYTNLSFRQLCAENGCELCYTEMVHINHIVSQPLDTIPELITKDEDYPTTLQLVGDFTNLKLTREAFEKVELLDFDIIDFNLGCPSPKIAAGNSGASLLDNIKKVAKTIKEIKENNNKPITAKVRLGYKQNNISEIVNSLEKANIDAIAIHGRLGIENYSVKSNYFLVEEIAKTTSIPVIYNGDITAENYSKFKGIDVFAGLMVGRSALNDPSIFSLISEKTQKTKQENLKQFIKLAKKYNLEVKNQKSNLLQMVSGFSGARELRAKLAIAKTQEEIDRLI
ncbi:MAG: tRNA-dihydrouridine synthase family protein [archaeon]|jgi:tRNA-dihydrouridine synthase B